MPNLDRMIRDLSTTIDRDIVQVLGRVESLTARLAEVEELANDTEVTYSQLEMIESIKSRVDALDPTNPEILITHTEDG